MKTIIPVMLLLAVPLVFSLSVNIPVSDSVYGEMSYANDTATSINFAVQGTYYPVFFVSDEHNQGITFLGGFGQLSNLTVQYGGVYLLNWKMVGSGQNNHEYHAVPFIDSTELTECEDKKKMSAGGDINGMSGTCMVTLQGGEVITLRITDKTGTGTGNYYNGNLNMVRVAK